MQQPMQDSPLSGARPTSKKDEGLGTGSGDRGREECSMDKFSSRTCEQGTNGCVVVHSGGGREPNLTGGGAALPVEPPTETYVQPVPDHCDRIIWRGTYYSLPLTSGVAVRPTCQQMHDAIESLNREHGPRGWGKAEYEAALVAVAAGVMVDAPASESPALAQVLDALRVGKVACEWHNNWHDAEKCSKAMDAARTLAAVVPSVLPPMSEE